MFGMAGGSAGQFVVGPMIAGGRLETLLGRHGRRRARDQRAAVHLLPKPAQRRADALAEGARRALGRVFRNPQSILCGVIAGLLFIPTTIFDMVWGVRYLQEARGFDYGEAVMRSATVPFGWIIGCPLLGFVSTGSAGASR